MPHLSLGRQLAEAVPPKQPLAQGTRPQAHLPFFRPAPPRRRWPWVVSAARMGAAVALVVWLVRAPTEEGAPAPPAPPVSPAPAAPATPLVAPLPSAVTLDFQVTPANARISIDGRPLEAPRATLEARGEPARLRVEAPGYEPYQGEVLLTSSRTVTVTLARKKARVP